MKVEIRELSTKDGMDIFKLIKSFPDEEKGFYNPGQGVSLLDFPTFLQLKVNESRGIGLPEGFVPQRIFWLYLDGLPIGIGKLRSHLNHRLKEEGGHISYGILPEYRNQGYGTRLLEGLIDIGSRKGIVRFFLTCQVDNVASRRVIEKNGGVLESISLNYCKYWIDTGRSKVK